MRRILLAALSLAAFAACATFAACIDYSNPTSGSGEAGAPMIPSLTVDAGHDANVAAAGDAAGSCATRSYRGGAPGEVVCPGTPRCACDGEDICCMPSVDAVAGACGALSACRALALQCDGPEDCDGGVCCLEDRSGGGSSCKSGSACSAGQWLCRTDADCAGSSAGPHCVPLDLGAIGVDDRGLDGIAGTCAK